MGAGQMGFHLAERLSEDGQDVVLIEADSPGPPGARPAG